jgi:hypothetical protein
VVNDVTIAATAIVFLSPTVSRVHRRVTSPRRCDGCRALLDELAMTGLAHGLRIPDELGMGAARCAPMAVARHKV